MKKSLVALAALAVVGGASAQVTISGLIDTGVVASDFKGAKVTQVTSNNAYTTFLMFTGTEDLGGGLSAKFRFEIDPVLTRTAGPNAGAASSDVSNVANIGNGYSFLGLAGGFGELQFGTINTATLGANGIGQPFGTAIGSGYKTISQAATRYQNTLRYDTPAMNGLSGSFLYGFKDQYQNNASAAALAVAASLPLNGRDQIQEFGVKYANGPINVQFANLTTTTYNTARTAVDCATATTAAVLATAAPGTMIDGGLGNACTDGNTYKVNTLAANYNIGATTVYAWLQNTKQNGQIAANPAALTSVAPITLLDRKAQGLALKHQVSGELSVFGGTRKIARSDAEAYNAAAAVNTAAAGIGRTTTLRALGAEYDLSKRTMLYARYENINDAAILINTRGAVGSGYTGADQGTNKIQQTAFGIKHTF